MPPPYAVDHGQQRAPQSARVSAHAVRDPRRSSQFRAGDGVAAGQLCQPGAIEPAQDQYRLSEAGQRPGSGAGATSAGSRRDHFYRDSLFPLHRNPCGVSHQDTRPARWRLLGMGSMPAITADTRDWPPANPSLPGGPFRRSRSPQGDVASGGCRLRVVEQTVHPHPAHEGVEPVGAGRLLRVHAESVPALLVEVELHGPPGSAPALH